MIKFSLDEKEQFYSAPQIADALGVTPTAVTNWLKSGKMEGFKAGGRWRVRKEAVFNFVDKSTGG